MAHAERHGARIVLTTEYREKDQCKLIPGCGWSEKEQCWSLPISWGGCKVLRGVFGQNLSIGPELVKWATGVAEHVSMLMSLRTRVEYEHPATDFVYADLYPFQRVGVDFITESLDHNGGVLIGDEMGSGKTIQAIRAMYAVDADDSVFPMIVVCPNSMKLTWAKEIKRWWPDDERPEVIVLKGSTLQRRKQLDHLTAESQVIVIVNWEGVRALSRLSGYGSIELKKCTAHGGVDPEVTDNQCEVHPRELNSFPWKTVIIDEAHRMIHPQAKQTRAVWQVAKDSSYRLALSGTPIANTPDQLWSVMHFLSVWLAT